MRTAARIKALDLFAGTGWGVACQRLGIKEAGVEIMPEAIATRTANGMETIYRDVWDGLTLTAEQHRAAKNMGSGMVERHGERPGRPSDAPAFTVRASAGGTEPGGFIWTNDDGSTRKATVAEVSALQSYPNVVYRNGNQANAARRTLDHPAPTLLFGHNSNKVEWMDPELAAIPSASGKRVTVEEASALQSYPTMLRSNYGTGGDASNRGERTVDQPAPTLTSKADRNKWDGREQMSADQAGTLQTYEKPFVWCGSKSKQFLQIGNAVPPLLAEAILAALIGIRAGR